MREFSSIGCDCTGLEVSDFSVEQSRINCMGLNCNIIKMPAKDMTWSKHFDLAIAMRHTLGFMSQDELKVHLHRIWEALKPNSYFILTVPYTLEMGREMLPVHRWVESDGKFTLVDKYITDNNVKVERCVLFDSMSDIMEEFYEEQRYYSWVEIIDMLHECGFKNINVLKNFDDEIATDGKEARIYFMQK